LPLRTLFHPTSLVDEIPSSQKTLKKSLSPSSSSKVAAVAVVGVWELMRLPLRKRRKKAKMEMHNGSKAQKGSLVTWKNAANL